MKNKKALIIGLSAILLSFFAAFILNLPTFGGGKNIKFNTTYKNDPVTLKGSMWTVEGSEYAALICPGYSCDRQKWRPMADLLVANGFTTMSFDYSGQGASSGTIGFDNAKTDAIPVQIDAAIEELHSITGIAYDHIILVGHSMGGRSILRLLHDYNCSEAETSVTSKTVAGAILLSPEVNYHYNAQASLFAGTSDAEEEPWSSYSASCLGSTPLYLFGSEQDDIVSDEDIHAIYRHAAGGDAPVTETVTTGILHSYEMYSPEFGDMVNNALTEITGRGCSYNTGRFLLCYISWALGLLGLGFTLYYLNNRCGWTVADPDSEKIPDKGEGDGGKAADTPYGSAVRKELVLTDSRTFLIRKALMWIPGIFAGFLVCCFCVAMPFGSPVMNIPYMCFIAGYGFVMLYAYKKGKIKGTEGKLPGLSFRTGPKDARFYRGIAVIVALCFFVWYVLRATMYRLIPLNARLFWVVFAALVMTIGYYISACENEMLKNAGSSAKTIILYNLIQYVPLILLVLFYLVLKSYSGMIGQLQNMLLMYIFCIPAGNLVKKITDNRLLGAVTSGFLFQTLMITSAALISMF